MRKWWWSLAVMILLTTGCGAPRISLFGDGTQPWQEYVLQGTEEPKVLLIQVDGFISTEPQEEWLRKEESVVQKVVSQLRRAREDENVRAVLVKIDSPGGSVTASNIIFHELYKFRRETGVKVVAAFMGLATSGGYYIALPADYIMSHPTTITGSVGAIFLRPNVTGLMEKIGVEVYVNASGKYKDIGSPFRPSTEAEEAIIQNIIADMGTDFVQLVAKSRQLAPGAVDEIATGRIFLADQALDLGLVDGIGYLDDAFARARELAGLPPDAKLVVYRRTEYANDTFYNTLAHLAAPRDIKVIDLGLADYARSLKTGVYYLWLPNAKP